MKTLKKCKHGWKDGSCCCNCRYQIELRKHPSNISFGKGKITEGCGWVCLNPEVNEGISGVYKDSKHGMCEIHSKR